jgi:multimeric flavodoxin WrbA
VRTLLVVYQSRSGGTQSLVEAAVEGARLAIEETNVVSGGTERTDGASGVSLDTRHAFDTGPDDVKAASAVLIATPANFGYMSGAMKDFFERIYHVCLEVTAGMPYAMIVKGDTDVDGAAASVERIATGMRWREVLPRLSVVGDVTTEHLDAAIELGATLAAGLDAGIY